MPIFRKAPKIPEVGQPTSGAARDPYGPASGRMPTDAELEAEYGGGSGAAARGGAPAMSSYQAPQPSSYQPQGAPYQSGQAGSFQAQSYQPNDPYSTFGPEQKQALDPEEEEIESIKHEIRSTKGESLSSTRNALRLARETEETATNTMVKLGEQSDKIGDTERHLDLAKAHASRADDNARQIKQLNRSIFRPKFTWDKRAKREAEEARVVQRHIDERTERELTREEVLRSQRRVDETVSMNPLQRLKALKSQQATTSDPNIDKAVNRSRYQFEATESDDEVEDEIDSNLNDISALSARLNHLGRAMGEEVDFQNSRLGRVGDKTSELDTRIYAGTQRLNHLR